MSYAGLAGNSLPVLAFRRVIVSVSLGLWFYVRSLWYGVLLLSLPDDPLQEDEVREDQHDHRLRAGLPDKGYDVGDVIRPAIEVCVGHCQEGTDGGIPVREHGQHVPRRVPERVVVPLETFHGNPPTTKITRDIRTGRNILG